MPEASEIWMQLEPRSISAVGPSLDLDCPLPQSLSGALAHQAEVYFAARNHDVVLDLAPTGTGKTLAGLSTLLHAPNKNAAYIAPTNALIGQQVEAAKYFVERAKLPHVVLAATAADVRRWPGPSRPGEKLYNVLANPATLFPEIGAGRPVLLVTNPDIFYYATFFSYANLDRVNVAQSFLASFGTVIFDEFHLYDAKQLVGLLFYLSFSQDFGFFRSGRRIILLTATPEPACQAALEALASQGVRIAHIDGERSSGIALASQTAVQLCLRPLPDTRDVLLDELAEEVAVRLASTPDSHGAVILDSKDAINRLSDRLIARGLAGTFGRITGSTPLKQRQIAAECRVILATSTVDVGYNFERLVPPPRQNLDWLLLSARNRSAFWQRLGRVGRVLGKSVANIPSQVLAYLPCEAWNQGLSDLDISGGREALRVALERCTCLDKPFLSIYWRSEALLEVARPVLQLEKLLRGLEGQPAIEALFENMRQLLGAGRPCSYYRHRMRLIESAGMVARYKPARDNKHPFEWMSTFMRNQLIEAYLKEEHPEDLDAMKAGDFTYEEAACTLRKEPEARELCRFARNLELAYAPLFRFRDSLFSNLIVQDPHGLLLDEPDQIELDPLHLLRYYEFMENSEGIVLRARAEPPYSIHLRLRFIGESRDFAACQLNKLQAFESVGIERKRAGALAPCSLLSRLSQEPMAGVAICPTTNAALRWHLKKSGVESYPLTVVANNREQEYLFFPNLSGILAVASGGARLRLPDDEDLYIV